MNAILIIIGIVALVGMVLGVAITKFEGDDDHGE